MSLLFALIFASQLQAANPVCHLLFQGGVPASEIQEFLEFHEMVLSAAPGFEKLALVSELRRRRTQMDNALGVEFISALLVQRRVVQINANTGEQTKGASAYWPLGTADGFSGVKSLVAEDVRSHFQQRYFNEPFEVQNAELTMWSEHEDVLVVPRGDRVSVLSVPSLTPIAHDMPRGMLSRDGSRYIYRGIHKNIHGLVVTDFKNSKLIPGFWAYGPRSEFTQDQVVLIDVNTSDLMRTDLHQPDLLTPEFLERTPATFADGKYTAEVVKNSAATANLAANPTASPLRAIFRGVSDRKVVLEASFSRDAATSNSGDRILIWENGESKIIDLRKLEIRRLSQAELTHLSPDGTWAFKHDGETLMFVNVDNQTERSLSSEHLPQFVGRRSEVLLQKGEGRFELFDLTENPPRMVQVFNSKAIGISPSGKYLIETDAEGRLQLWGLK